MQPTRGSRKRRIGISHPGAVRARDKEHLDNNMKTVARVSVT